MKILLIFLSFLLLVSCSTDDNGSGPNENTNCKSNTDCKAGEECNSYTKKCEEPFIDTRWTYQSEPFDDIEQAYLFIDKSIKGDPENNPTIEQKIKVVDLKNKKYVKTISFPYSNNIVGTILKNNSNGKFYFYNIWKKDGDKYGLMEIDPKTGIIKQVANTYEQVSFGAIAGNGKVYYVTQKACSKEGYSVSTLIGIYNPYTNKETSICVPSIIDYVHQNINGKIYTSGSYDDISISEINPDDDSLREILSGINTYGGYNLVSTMGDRIYYRIPYAQENKLSIDYVDIKTLEKGNIPLSFSTHTDGGTYYAARGGFNLGDDLFLFTYNRAKETSHLVKYNLTTKDFTWLYSNMPLIFKSYYDKSSNTVEIVPGLIFFMDSYEVKQFRGEDYKVPEPIKKF